MDWNQQQTNSIQKNTFKDFKLNYLKKKKKRAEKLDTLAKELTWLVELPFGA